jgi:acetyl-CoA acetyltransferase
MAFTVCQAPVVAHRSGPQRIEITRADGSLQTVAALELDAAASSAVFERSRDIRRLDVFFGLEDKGAPK